MDTTQTITIIFLFAIVIQFLVQRTKEILGDKVMLYLKAPLISLFYGVFFAFAFNLDIFKLLGYNTTMPIFTLIITGIILSAGATPIHELIEAIRKTRTDK